MPHCSAALPSSRFSPQGVAPWRRRPELVVPAAAIGVFFACVSPSARADVVCGSTSAGWNVPNGDAVFEQAPGVIQGVLAAVGEYRTHSMLSRGPDGWVTHATAITPPVNDDRSFLGSECNAPISSQFLYAATPGLETIGQGAIYTFLYRGGPVNFVAYQSGQNGVSGGQNAAIGNTFVGQGMSWVPWRSPSDSNQIVFAEAYNGTQIHYGWYQYMNIQGTAQGIPGVNTGVVCSTSLALWQHDALSGQAGYTGDVTPRSYPSNLIGNAAHALYNGVYSECTSQTGDMFASFGAFLQGIGTCTICLDCNICDSAANQMVNCFSKNDCTSNSASEWQGVVGRNAAVSISPDDIACWNYPANGTGAPCSGRGSSVWGWDVSETVQWNSGGNTYSCWN
jgi:hypothetical protein